MRNYRTTALARRPRPSKIGRFEARLRRFDLYRAMLDVVEQKIEEEALINDTTIAQVLGVSHSHVNRILSDNPLLMRIVSRYQRIYGRIFSEWSYNLTKE
jgi:AraC-like DNA-binding protein